MRDSETEGCSASFVSSGGGFGELGPECSDDDSCAASGSTESRLVRASRGVACNGLSGAEGFSDAGLLLDRGLSVPFTTALASRSWRRSLGRPLEDAREEAVETN